MRTRRWSSAGLRWKPNLQRSVQTRERTMIDSVSNAAGATRDLKKARRRAPLRMDDPTKLDRLPPHSPDAEQGVLGCVLLSPKESLPEVVSRVKGAKQTFYDLRHQHIFMVLVAMQDAGKPIDLITVQQQLKDEGLLEQVGGVAYLSQLQETVPSAANLDYYLDIVFEKWQLRRMVQVCTEVVARVYEYEGEVTQLLDEVQNDILNLPTASQDGPRPLKEFSGRIQDRLDVYARGIGMITGLPTGFRYLDRNFGGMHPAHIII